MFGKIKTTIPLEINNYNIENSDLIDKKEFKNKQVLNLVKFY